MKKDKLYLYYNKYSKESVVCDWEDYCNYLLKNGEHDLIKHDQFEYYDTEYELKTYMHRTIFPDDFDFGADDHDSHVIFTLMLFIDGVHYKDIVPKGSFGGTPEKLKFYAYHNPHGYTMIFQNRHEIKHYHDQIILSIIREEKKVKSIRKTVSNEELKNSIEELKNSRSFV